MRQSPLRARLTSSVKIMRFSFRYVLAGNVCGFPLRQYVLAGIIVRSRYGFAAGCEARLRLAVIVCKNFGLGPWFGLWPQKHWGKARTRGTAQSQIQGDRRGIASPHIRRRSRPEWNVITR